MTTFVVKPESCQEGQKSFMEPPQDSSEHDSEKIIEKALEDASQNSLGDQELQILHYVTDNAPISVREVVARWGDARGLARTTVLTMLERLRLKGFLTRKKQGGVWVYAPTSSKTEVLQNVVRDFVQKTLGGQIAPFVAYLTETRDISGEELAHLRQLVRDLEQEPQPTTQSRGKADTEETNTEQTSGGGTDTDALNTGKPDTGKEEAR